MNIYIYIIYIYVQFSFFKVSRMFHPFPHCQDAYVDDASGTSDFRGPSSDGHSGLRGLDVIAKARQRIREVKERERHGMTCRLCRWQCSKVDLIHGIMEELQECVVQVHLIREEVTFVEGGLHSCAFQKQQVYRMYTDIICKFAGPAGDI